VSANRNIAAMGPFAQLQSEIDRLFDQFSRNIHVPFFSNGDLVPSMDISETDKQIEVSAELPGLEPTDVEINLADNVLTIRGEKKAEKEEKDKNRRVIERSYGSFARAVTLPAGVDAKDIKATIANGVLTVTVAKPAPAVTKRIEIKPAA
jgi:HSP20 family protein